MVPIRSWLAECSWLSHRASERPLTPLTSLGQQLLCPLCVRVERCHSVPWGPWDEVELYLTASLGHPAASGAAKAETASVLLQLREFGSVL